MAIVNMTRAHTMANAHRPQYSRRRAEAVPASVEFMCVATELSLALGPVEVEGALA